MPCPASAASAGCPAGGFVKDNNVYNFTSLYPAGFTPRFTSSATIARAPSIRRRM